MNESRSLVCPKCSRQYDGSQFKLFGYEKCKDCKVWLEVEAAAKSGASNQELQSGTAANAKTISAVDLKDVVEAQNRTTYAVRSLARFFFISLQTSLFGGGIIMLTLNNRSNYDFYGNLKSDSAGWVTFGSLVAFVGFLIAVYVGRRELSKSEIH